MDTLHNLIEKITSGDYPAGAFGGAGIVLFLFAVKAKKNFFKFLWTTIALAAFAGAVWWHLHQQGKI